VDRLESIIVASQRLPFSNRLLVNEQALLDCIDQMRSSIPDEVKQAKRVSADRERIIANAQGEADQILAAARERASYLLQDRELTKSAEARAQLIIDEARREALRVKAEADNYAMRILGELNAELARQQQTAQNGIEVLKRRLTVEAPQGQPPAPPPAK
jgi:vacuolar-type H+-ATPase subunit H